MASSLPVSLKRSHRTAFGHDPREEGFVGSHSTDFATRMKKARATGHVPPKWKFGGNGENLAPKRAYTKGGRQKLEIYRKYLQAKVLLLMAQLFGSLAQVETQELTLKEVATLNYMPVMTLWNMRKRYVSSFLGAPSPPPPKPKKRSRNLKITPQVAAYLLNIETLQKWSTFTLQMRTVALAKHCRCSLAVDTLRKFYVRNHIRVRHCNFQYKNSHSVTQRERWQFAASLFDLVHLSNRPNVVYFDETSLNLWPTISHTWSGAGDERVEIPKNVKRGSGITVYGCIGERMRQALFYHADSSNSEDFQKFLKLVRKNFDDPYDPIIMVLDNLPAHKTEGVQEAMFKYNIEPMY